MKNRITKYTLIVFSVIAIGYYFFNQTQMPEKLTKDRLDQKLEPSDEFFLQRSYPDGKFNIEAYIAGLNEAKVMSQARNAAEGFDVDWTTQGPGNIGARINTIAVHPQDENIVYIGFSQGGVFKTENGGNSWFPIFDDQLFLGIGDITIDPNNPETIYVGTGDVNISGYPFIGDGLYKSIDGGNTWENIGLEQQRIISKVIVHPNDSNTIYASAMGLPFERNNDRGLYKTTDGGLSWNQVLFLSDSTGIIDFLINPQNPEIVYAAGWDRIRNNTESIISGQGARLYKSLDGGNNWSLLEGGLPNAAHSRIGLAMSGSDPDVIFAEYVSTNRQLEAIYKTSNGGQNWSPIPTDEDLNGLSSGALGGFGWYFGKIRVNPANDDDIFLLGIDLWRTQDGGNTWSPATPPWWEYSVHADKHDLVFLPSGDILLATDGGLYKTDVNTSDWTDIENIPATQFYRVAYNPHAPELYYGGAQDNGSTGGNVATINSWDRIYGGDGFQMAFDPFDPNRFFTETQNGNIYVTLDGGNDFEWANNGIDFSDRRNWDMPYFISSHDNQGLFTGTHRVYFGYGQIPEWSPISPDLTDGIDEQHRYHNITAIDESTILQGLLYVGTGDGNVWRSDNFGGDWNNISDGLPDQYVTDIVPSPDDTDVVFATFSGYRDNDFLPRIHKSYDRGNTWESISGDLPDLAINELLVYPEHEDSVLFVATDGGVYGSINYGETWERLGGNMPVIPVYDLVLNEAKNELVAGTFARSIMSFPIDSIGLGDGSITSHFEPNALQSSRISLYPNPATEYINLEIQNFELNRPLEVVILNASGQLMYNSGKHFGQSFKTAINIKNWSSGTYIVKLKNRHQVDVQQFVIIE